MALSTHAALYALYAQYHRYDRRPCIIDMIAVRVFVVMVTDDDGARGMGN